MAFDYRQYQQDAVNTAWGLSQQGDRPILCAPTASGKSVMSAMLADRCVSIGERVGLLTPRRELVKQITSTFQQVCGPENVGVLMAGERWHRERPVQVISDSTIKVRAKKSDLWLPDLDVLQVDECHLSLAKGTLAVLNHYKDAGTRIIGLTATPSRQTGKGLGAFYTRIHHVTTVRRLIADGYLCPLEYYAGKLVDVRKIRTVRGDFEQKELAKRSIKLVGDVFQTWCRLASDRQTIVFAVDIAHAEALNAEFQSGNVASEVLHSKIDEAERARIDADFKAGRIQVLVNVTIASYGYDAPRVSCIVLARPTKSIVLHLQMCLDTETEILTEKGWRNYLEVSEFDNCAAFNMDDDSIEWCPVQEKIVRPMHESEVMYGYESNNASIRVTNKHDLVIKARRAKKWMKQEAYLAANRLDMSYLPVAGTLDLPDADITDSEIRFLGWVLSDGTINRQSKQVVIYQSLKHPHYCEDIEQTLNACGFRWGKYESKKSGNEFGMSKNYCPINHYSVSFGQPRRLVDRHLSGCGHLNEWLDKSIPSIYETLSARQFSLLIKTMFMGDGSKFSTADYIPRTIEISFDSKYGAADRIQELAVVRGWRCNKSSEHRKASKIEYLRLRPRNYITVAGKNVKDSSIGCKNPYKRSRLEPVKFIKNEIVWCVRNRLGTLVTRRKGKVVILGNCGRGMRVMDGKKSCLVLDHADNVRRIGRADDLYRWRLDETKQSSENWTRHEAGENEPKPVICPECAYIFESSPECPKCGWKPAAKQRHVETLEDAELVRMGGKESKKKEKPFPDPETFYRMLRGYAMQKVSGNKKGWAAYRFKDKRKEWPPSHYEHLSPMTPSPEVLGFIKHIQIRNRYARKKRTAAA